MVVGHGSSSGGPPVSVFNMSTLGKLILYGNRGGDIFLEFELFFLNY